MTATDPPMLPARRKGRTELFIAMMCMFTGAFMQQLDSTIITVALPYMQGNLQSSPEQATWILTSYIIATAIMTAPTSAIASRIGYKTLFQICIAGFTVTSVMCGLAQTLDQMVVFRFLQGASSGAIMPAAYAVMLDRYEGKERTRMIALFSMMSMLGAIAGPALGGFITEIYSWRWNFFLNVPIGAVVFAGVAVFFDDSKEKPQPAPFDIFGFLSLSAGLAVMQLLLDRGPSQDWFGSTEIIIEAFIASIVIYLYVVHTATSKNHFIPPAIFRDRNFAIGTVIGVTNMGTTFASTALLPTYLQTLGGRSVLETGMLLTPRGIGAIAAAFLSVRLLSVMDKRLQFFLGWFCLAWSMWEMAHWTPAVRIMDLMFVSAVQGAGLTIMSAATNALSFTTLPPRYHSVGSGAYILTRHLGSAIMISIAATSLANSVQEMHAVISESASPFNRALSAGAANIYWNPYFPGTAHELDAVVSQNAALLAYSNVFMLMLYLSFLIPLAAMFLRETKSPANALSGLE